MVLIEYNYEDLKFVWIDGFVPDYEEVLKKVKDIDTGYFGRSEIEFTKEELNKELLAYLTQMYCNDMIKEKYTEYRSCSTYLFAFENIPKPQYITNPAQEDFRDGSSVNNYRHTIFVIDYVECSGAPRCLDNVVKKAIENYGFRIREPETYKYLKHFEKSCKEILNRMGAIYHFPRLISEELLESLGFSKYSCAEYR